MRNRRVLTKVAIVLALLGGVGFGAVQPAGAVVLSCGAVVTTSIVLENDIGPCHGDGIVVGADNITVDLNGHQVFGEGGGNVIHQAAGVYSDNHSGVVVRNGVIHDFYHGVRIRQGHHNRVTGLRVQDNVGGNGIVFETTTDNVADLNTVIHNGRFSGISTFNTNALPPAAARNTIRDNVLILNNGSLFGSPPSHGIAIENGSGHIVRGNTVFTSGRDGITLFSGVTNVLIEANTVRDNGNNGINVRNGSTDNTVQFNSVWNNVQRGIVVAGQRNRILFNVSRGNGQFDLQDTNVACDANVWANNSARTVTPDCARG